MSIRPGLRLVLLAAFALAWIGLPPDAFAQPQQQELAANVVRPVHPILIHNQHGPLLRVIIDVGPGQTARLASLEFSLHFNEGSWRDETHRLRRYTIRLDGFVSLHAPLTGGELTTKPLKFTGRRLSLNYSTSAAGSLRVEIQDATGQPIPGFSVDDADELFGDSVEQTASWKNTTDINRLVGQEVRLRFVLHDGDLFSFQFRE